MMSSIELTHENFDDVIEKNEFLLIDFGAEWCAPCKSFNKVIEKVAQQYPEVVFASVDIDAEKALADEFNVKSVPSVMILRNKVVVFAESGALSAASLTDLLEQTKALDPEELRNRAAEEEE